MSNEYREFHPLLAALLTKLADEKNTTRECWHERFDWVKAGCPVYRDGRHPASIALEDLLERLQ